jgi:hypothetical protein
MKAKEVIQKPVMVESYEKLEELTVGDKVEFMIDGCFVARMRFTEKDDKDTFVQEAHNEFDVIAKDNLEARVEMFLVKTVLVKSSV